MNEQQQEQKGWTLAGIWNASLAKRRRLPQRRDHIWASEIGKNHWERYQKMSGRSGDTELPARVLRKFAAGEFFEEVVGQVLRQVGILRASQERVEIPATADTLAVTGRIDYRAGGLVDWDVARANVRAEEMPEFLEAVCLDLIDEFERAYPQGLGERNLEIKSVNSQLFWAKGDYLLDAYPWHKFQAYTYSKWNGLETDIVYISKDDLTIKQFCVMPNSEALEGAWQEDVREMTRMWRAQEEPAKPESVVFDPKKKLKFSIDKVKHEIVGSYCLNWQVERSEFFKAITGFDDVESWEEAHKADISARNGALKDDYKLKLTQ